MEILFYYFDFKEPAKKLALYFYGSLISQLIEEDGEVPAEIEKLYENSNGKPPVLGDLKKAFLQMISTRGKIAIVVDALDHCDDRGEIMDSLLELVDPSKGKVKLLVTSRQEQDIKTAFAGAACLCIKADDIKGDIGIFLRDEIERLPKLRRLKPETKDLITTSLSNGAKGM